MRERQEDPKNNQKSKKKNNQKSKKKEVVKESGRMNERGDERACTRYLNAPD